MAGDDVSPLFTPWCKKKQLVQVYFPSNEFATHVTCAQRFRADIASSVTAQKGHVTSTFHANRTRVRLLDFRYSRFQVAQTFR